ncbi:MAG: peptidase M64 [Bacteroidetes bacterium]|nr:MAG: peptidase M64 [Bacteroidota bacterium]
MKTCLSLLLCLYFYPLYSQDISVTQVPEQTSEESLFDRYFSDKTLRIDYVLGGHDSVIQVYLWQLKEEPLWGGPRKNLTDPWNSGNFCYSVYDSANGTLLYRKGFSTLFEEYQGTPDAKQVSRAYPMTATLPYPLQPVRFEIDRRSFTTGEFDLLFSLNIDPKDYFILHEAMDPYPVTHLTEPGDPATQLDIVFLAEGYTTDEMPKFLEDARRISNYFLSVSPFSEYPEKITFWAVETPSVGSGIDIPGQREYVNTGYNSSFFTFDSDRYLTTPDTWSMRDAAASAPYDQIVILVNSRKYGGGGFYNHYCESTVDNELSEIVAIHEFGHAFGGLADEYVGGVNYDGFYNLKVEPWEPNITTNVDFGSKWKPMISDTIPIPTPRDSTYQHVVGMFEGGGYMAKGVYSPVMNCRMKDNNAEGFCPVCREAIRQKILFYCD